MTQFIVGTRVPKPTVLCHSSRISISTIDLWKEGHKSDVDIRRTTTKLIKQLSTISFTLTSYNQFLFMQHASGPQDPISDFKFISTLRLCLSLEVLCIFPPIIGISIYAWCCSWCNSSNLCTLSGELWRTIFTAFKYMPAAFEARLFMGFPRATGVMRSGRFNTEFEWPCPKKQCQELLVIYITNDPPEWFNTFEGLGHLTVQSHERAVLANRITDPRFLISVSTLPQKNYHDIYVRELGSMYDMIGTILPPSSLKSIKILTHLGSEEYYLRAQENQAVSFIQAFASHHPKVQTIEISYGIYWTGMYTAKWSRICWRPTFKILRRSSSKILPK